MSFAPIALFVYNRPWHTRQVIEALQRNPEAPESDLIVYSDGAKNPDDERKVLELRQYLSTVTGFKSVKVVQQVSNLGLSQSVIRGVSATVKEFGKIIVVEDDLVVSPAFLGYMNTALELYENDRRVISIHGFMYPVKDRMPETFFLRGADCWGWATWERGWSVFEADGKKLLLQLENKRLVKDFDFNGGYPYAQMLRLQIAGLNSSWAIRWYASAFVNDMVTLYPGKSLVKNIGFDNTGRHSGGYDWFHIDQVSDSIKLNKIPAEESAVDRMVVEKYFKSPKIRLLTTVMKLRGNWRLFKSRFV